MPDPSPLDAALTDQPWAMSGLLLGLDHIRDVNGRPLGERRAPAESRRDVPIELVPCPYNDERRGRPMNRSALEPTMRQFGAVATQVAAFHAALPAEAPSWPRMLSAVIDQLAAPARYLLAEQRRDGPVPAELSAGHKLAAGYFGTLLALLRQQASGVAEVPLAGVEGFSAFVQQRHALIGASEVCAGPPHNINVMTRLFVQGASASWLPRGLHLAPERLELAELLTAQVRLGIAWEVFDEVTERALLRQDPRAPHLQPRTEYLATRISTRTEELAQRPAPQTSELARHLPSQVQDTELAAALADPGQVIASPDQVALLAQVLGEGDAAIVLDEASRARYAPRLASLLCRYRLLVQAQWQLEQAVRRVVGRPSQVGLPLNALLCPRPRTLEWFEVFTGHRLQCTVGQHAELVIRNHHRVVAFE